MNKNGKLLSFLVLVCILSVQILYAAVVFQTGGATGDTTEWTSTSGTATNATDQAYTGTHSFKGNTGAGPTAAIFQKNSVLADAGRRLNLRFRSSNWNGGPDLIRFQNSSGQSVFQIAGNAGDDFLHLANGSGGQFAAGSHTLNDNTWYRITVSYTVASTSSWHIKVYVDGALDIDQDSTATFPRTGTDRLIILAGASLGTSVSCWFDDIYLDDTSDLSDPGDIPISEGGTVRRNLLLGI